jgi:hypothetical protein
MKLIYLNAKVIHLSYNPQYWKLTFVFRIINLLVEFISPQINRLKPKLV